MEGNLLGEKVKTDLVVTWIEKREMKWCVLLCREREKVYGRNWKIASNISQRLLKCHRVKSKPWPAMDLETKIAWGLYPPASE